MKQAKKTDNENPVLKAAFRRHHLPQDARILDLFCGTGEMYHRAYQNNCRVYYGIDNRVIHDPAICQIANNEEFLATHNIGHYNVFDLDDWGCPWKLMMIVLRKCKLPEIHMFVTDGSVLGMRVSSRPPKIVCAANRIPKGFTIPAGYRFYQDMFNNWLYQLHQRTHYKCIKATYYYNQHNTVCYWYLKFVMDN